MVILGSRCNGYWSYQTPELPELPDPYPCDQAAPRHQERAKQNCLHGVAAHHLEQLEQPELPELPEQLEQLEQPDPYPGDQAGI